MATESSSSFSFIIYAVGSSETDFVIPASILTLFEFGVAIGDQFTLYRVDSSGTKTTLIEADGDWTAISSSLIRLTVAITDGSLELRRETQKSDTYVNFQTADNIGANELDFSKYQNFMLSQESFDRAQRALPLGTDDHWDAEDRKVRRVLAGSLGTDGVNVAQLAAADLGGLSAGLNTPFTYTRTGDGTEMGPGNAVDLADNSFLTSGDEDDVDGNVMQEEELFVSVNGVIWNTGFYNLTGTFFNFIGFTPGVSDSVQVRWLPGTIVASFEENSVSTDALVDGSVTTPKLAADAVTGAKIGDDEVDSEHLVAGSIDPEHLATDSVTTVKVLDANITAAKLVGNILGGTYVARTRILDTASVAAEYRNTETKLILAHIGVRQPSNATRDFLVQVALDSGSGSPGAWVTIYNFTNHAERHELPFTVAVPVGSWIRVTDPNDLGSTNNGSNSGLNILNWTDFIFGV